MIDLALALAAAFVLWMLMWSDGERRRLDAELRDVDQHAATLVHSNYSHPIARAFFESRVFRSIVCWLAVAVLYWLDRDGCLQAQQSAIFGAIVSVFEAVGEFFGFVGTAVATTLVPVVTWLVATLGYIWDVVKNFIVGTGAIFSKVWDGLGVVWDRVLKPALVFLDQKIVELRDWLKATFQPVFDFLRAVRDVVTRLYDTFVKPVLAVIDFIRQLDRVLQVFHINLLSGLDAVLTRVEQRIDGVVQWLYARLNDVFNILNTIVGLDGFFQRYMFLHTQARDVGYSWRIMLNSWSRPLSDDQVHHLHHFAKHPTPDEAIADTAAWLGGDEANYGADLDAAVATWEELFGEALDVTA